MSEEVTNFNTRSFEKGEKQEAMATLLTDFLALIKREKFDALLLVCGKRNADGSFETTTDGAGRIGDMMDMLQDAAEGLNRAIKAHEE